MKFKQKQNEQEYELNWYDIVNTVISLSEMDHVYIQIFLELLRRSSTEAVFTFIKPK